MWFRPRLKLAIAVLVTSASLAYGLGPSVAWASGGSAAPAAPAASKRLPTYSGEALFRGLFFRQGAVGQKLPDLAIAPMAPTGDGATVLDTLIAQMRQSDPRFFDRFAKGILSGNRPKILAAIKDAQTVFDNALVATYHATVVTKGSQIGYCVFGPIAIAVAAVVVLVVVGAGAVVVVAAAAVVWVWFWAPASDPASRLAQEKWVNKIALSPLAATA